MTVVSLLFQPIALAAGVMAAVIVTLSAGVVPWLFPLPPPPLHADKTKIEKRMADKRIRLLNNILMGLFSRYGYGVKIKSGGKSG